VVSIARELRPNPGDPKVWFTSPESFAKLLSNRNRALMVQIAGTHPASLHELATSTVRTPGNVSARANADGCVPRCITVMRS